ncbi:MAG: hypothetical protein ACJ79R_13970 [Anaeromyxobacteraceae bacterium]
MAKRKKQNWDDVAWTPFVPIDPPFADEVPAERRAGPGPRWMANSIYVVLLQVPHESAPFGVVVHLAITTHDQQPRHDWREMQRIKNELVGESVEAIELYPSENRLVDNANWFHLFCFPRLALNGGRFPFGFDSRFVSEGSIPGFNRTGEGFRQRAFRPEFRPQDLHRGDEQIDLGAADKVCGRCPHDGSAVVFRNGNETVRRLDDEAVVMLHGECLKEGHVFLVAGKRSSPSAFAGEQRPGSGEP